MANVIGQLLVELGVNTAHMKEGFDKATHMAKQFGDQMKQSFSELGKSVQQFAGEFTGLGGAMGETMQPLINALGPLTKSLGTAGGAAAGLAIALPAVGLAALGIAVHFSETAARLQDLSEATGVSVEQLSLLGNVASTHGISVDQMGKAMERMARSALQAAKAGPEATNVYKDLGVAVKNADGTMRDSADIFNDVSAKLAAMPDGAVKTADAIKLFGRAGAELIPLLNEGGDKLAVMEGHFKALNAVVSGSTAKASEELKENMTLMGAAFTGVENELTKQLVPALNEVAQEFVSAFEGKQDVIKSLVSAVAFLAKSLLELVQIAALIGDAFLNSVEFVQGLLEGFGTIIKGYATAAFDLMHGDPKAAWRDWNAAGVEAWKGVVNTAKDSWRQMKEDAAKTAGDINRLWAAEAPEVTKKKEKQPEVNPSPDTSFITNVVKSLERQAQKEEELAKSTGISTQAQIAATAAAAADETIQKLRDEAVSKGIENNSKYKATLDAAIPRIQAAALWQETFKVAISDNSKLDALTQSLKKQTAALGDAADGADSYTKQQNKLRSELVPAQDALAELGKQLADMRDKFGESDPRVRDLTRDFEEQKTKLEGLRSAQKAFMEQWSNSQAAVEVNKLKENTAALTEETRRLMELDPYAKQHADIQKIIDDKHMQGKAEAEVRAGLEGELAAQMKLQAATAAGAALKNVGVDPQQQALLKQEIADLQKIEALWLSQGKDVAGVTQAIQKQQAALDALNAKQGGFFAGAKAGFSNWVASLQTSGEFMQKMVSSALDGITSNFAQMVATGKANWGSLEQSMEEEMLKFAASTALKSAMSAVGKALSGQGGLLGSIGSMLGGGGQAAGAAAQTAAESANTVALGVNTAALTQLGIAMQMSSLGGSGGGGGGGGIGGIFSSLFSGLSSGGGQATGGSVMPGKYYTVGEHGPETLIPGSSGTIIPNGGGNGGNVTVVQNIQTPSPDAFRSSMKQIHAAAMTQASSAAARLKG